MRSHYIYVAIAAATVIGGPVIATTMTGDGDETAVKPPASESTSIIRGDLADETSVSGTLTYSRQRKITAGKAGTVTRLPASGAVITQGKALFESDRKRTVLMYGKVPLYRPLRQGTNGPDVRQLEKALASLGHGEGVTVDNDFSAATARAVRRWQHSLKHEKTGVVDAAQVVFLPSSVRIAGHEAVVGDKVTPGKPMVTVTGTGQIVEVKLGASKQGLAKRGAKARIELPSKLTVKGTITEIGAVAKKDEDSTEPEVTVRIELARQKSGLDRAPVTVNLESARRENVLSVPVEALLALREGGYGVELMGENRRIVAVQPGVYAGGRVEISGQGLAAGMRVGMAEQ